MEERGGCHFYGACVMVLHGYTRYGYILYMCVYMCVGAVTTERTRPPVLHGGCHRHTHTHIHYAYFSLYTAQCVCACEREREYGHVRVLDDVIIIMWLKLFCYFLNQHSPSTYLYNIIHEFPNDIIF